VTHPRGEGEKPIYIPHVCNDIPAWGRGFVNAITARWGPGPRERYLNWGQGRGLENFTGEPQVVMQSEFELGGVQLLQLPNRVFLFNMVAQKGVRGSRNVIPLKYDALVTCMKSLPPILQPGAEIHCPKFGSGLAGGRWAMIEQLIQLIWTDKGIPAIVYGL
jgi:hypothetical protein